MANKQEVTVKTTNLPAGMTAGDLMNEFGVGANDIVLPRILLMQNTSEYVGEEKAKLGDLVNSQTLEVLGGFTKPIEIVPLKKLEDILVFDTTQQPQKFLKKLEATPINKGLKYEDVEDGIMVKRFLIYTFRCLLLEDIKKGTAYPYELTFKSTSLKAGKQLASMMFQSLAMNQYPYNWAYQVLPSKEKNESNYYAVLKTAKGAKLDPEQFAVAKHWSDQLRTKNVVTEDDSVPF